MTPRERVLIATAGGMPDRVPFQIWSNKFPSGDIGDRLLELGTCVIVKSSVWETQYPGIDIVSTEVQGTDGRTRHKTEYHTSAGTLTHMARPTEYSTWTEKRLFSGTGDYKALELLIRSRHYTPTYERFEREDRRFGDHSIGRPATIKTPMQDLIYGCMGVEAFSFEWAENRSKVLGLFDALSEDRKKRLEIAASSCASFVIVEANISPKIVGRERFEEYYIPQIQEACEIVHSRGKLAGAHLDSNNVLLAPQMARTDLDFIESFTPPPECDMSIEDARKMWPEMALHLNFPSSLHLGGSQRVREAARRYLLEAAPGDRFVFGVLENLPRTDLSTLVDLAEVVFERGATH